MRDALKQSFSLDLRSLAFFRIGLASVIIADLLHRARDLKAHYTDFGIFPTDAWAEFFTWPFSPIHSLHGSVEFQAAIFILHGFFAFLLLAGYRTRLVTIILWVLATSLTYRNVNIIYRGDLFICVLTFWSIFLPLNARFSIDAALNRQASTAPNRLFTLATIALSVQIGLIYFFAGVMKNGVDWTSGSAIYHTLYNDTRVTEAGRILREFPDFMRFLTHSVVVLEWVSPLLLFIPFAQPHLRLTGLLMLVAMHTGFILFMDIGLFPYICFVTLSVLLPGEVWDRLARKTHTPERQAIRIYYDEGCEFCRKTCLLLRNLLLLPASVKIEPAQTHPEAGPLLEQHNSWVVMDAQGTPRLRWDAVSWLVRQSPVFMPFGALMNLKPFAKIGDKLYGLIGANRHFLGRITRHALPYKDEPVGRLNLFSKIVIPALLLTVTIQNFAPVTPGLKTPATVNVAHHMLGLRQGWGFFAPNPSKENGWYVIPGRLANGDVVDVYRNSGMPVSWEEPARISDTYKNYRWRKYLVGQVWRGTNYNMIVGDQYDHYSAYLCRSWNASHTADKRLLGFDIYVMDKKKPFGPEDAVITKIHRHSAECSDGGDMIAAAGRDAEG